MNIKVIPAIVEIKSVIPFIIPVIPERIAPVIPAPAKISEHSE
ncbi:hypothetical protein [Spiroplasma alleghenense]|nr:hypothetical protein [Spiroplasma alleghenense]